MSGVVGILLAAGRSERFGRPKLLHPLPDGTPIGVAAARPLIRVLLESLAVVRPGDRELIDALAHLGLRIIENPDWEQGMGGSIAAGVRAAPDAAGWLIALADMPWIRAATVSALVDRMAAGASIIAPSYNGRRGHPVGFAAGWRQALRALAGDQGARRLIAGHTDRLTLHPTDDSGILRDVDRPADLYPE